MLLDRSVPNQDKVLQNGLEETDIGAVDAGWVCRPVHAWNRLHDYHFGKAQMTSCCGIKGLFRILPG